MDIELYIGVGVLAVLAGTYWILNRGKPSMIEDEINNVLNSEEYKVRGKYE